MRNVWIFLFVCLFPADAAGLARSQIKLKHFEQIDRGVFKGSTPHSEADYEYLTRYHIRYIVELRFWPFISNLEKRRAHKYGMELLTVEMSGAPWAPTDAHVARVLSILRDPRYHPVYFHCTLGRDRTALVAALYKMYFQGYSEQQAWRYMQRSGFKDSWTLRGLRSYLQTHPQPPPGVR